jgi:PTH1 family peptidyl-tRNA hydrolase
VRRLFGGRQSSLDRLVAGLGNPGPKYASTRHNIGFRVADRLAQELGGAWRGKFNGRLCEVRDGDARLALLEPETMMNDSGKSVAAAMRFYKLEPAALVVIHDEIDLELGDIRVKTGGGLAGHNGLRSIVQHIGTPEFTRVRIGVGRPERGDQRPVVDWGLTPFAPEVDVDDLIERATARTLELLRQSA